MGFELNVRSSYADKVGTRGFWKAEVLMVKVQSKLLVGITSGVRVTLTFDQLRCFDELVATASHI